MRHLFHIALLLCFAGSVSGNIPRNGGFRYRAASQRFTNNYTFDNGQPGRLGVLTAVGTPAQSTNTWSVLASGGLDDLGRVSGEQTALIRRPATGLALGASKVSATLDGNPVGVQFDGTDADGRWRAVLDLAPGSHTLKLSAAHPDGQYTAYATNTFNATGGADTVTNRFDANGNVTRRVWINSDGQTNRTQTLTWDAFDRLIKVIDRDTVGSGQDWVGIFDGLGRKVRTITTLVVSNTPITSPAEAVSTVDSWFDPMVEFQEVCVAVNGGYPSLKTYGPDVNGVYGGLDGVGGLERIETYGQVTPVGILQDYFGNVVGTITNHTVAWNPARFSSYGPVPGFQQSPLSLNYPLAQSVGWRGKHIEPTGVFYGWARPYEPASGRFLSHDPMNDPANLGGYSICGGDPVNRFDPDGRCVEATGNFIYNGGAAGYGLRALGGYLDSYNNSGSGGGWFTGFSGAVVNELAGASAPSTYVNGLSSYGHNVAGYYNDGGLLPATSYALTSWNVGAVYSGAANFDLHYDTAGQEVGDWYQRGTVLSGGVANTAGVAAGGLWGATKLGIVPPTAPPVDVPPVINPADTPPVITPAPTASAVSDTMATVSRWGRPGLQSGDWVMNGPANFWNYLMSGKYQPGWMPGGNIPAPFSAGESFSVPASALQTPPGFWGGIKGALGQRIYQPTLP